ncbi:hypothetical protein [Kribbella sp. NBC_00359]|uniref:hypothetical protein n=1 Tax=Kribbella sp. NBC_00359 TaxID=2975966 RepID=UPI002E1F5497
MTEPQTTLVVSAHNAVLLCLDQVSGDQVGIDVAVDSDRREYGELERPATGREYTRDLPGAS